VTERTGTSRLRPRARLIGLIGEDLISDEAVAVVELVKNAYDADARTVSVRFAEGGDGRLVVEDDGHGMELETVLGTWFEPGLSPRSAQSDRPEGGSIRGQRALAVLRAHGRFTGLHPAEGATTS
jgi:hypothetical protein